jgi:diguanylate cyclase (GGDEF)-like protein
MIMLPSNPTDFIYLICRLMLSVFAVAAAVNAVHYAHQDKPVYHRHLRVARIGAFLLGIAATMSCVDAMDNVFLRANEQTPLSSWLWLFCFDLLLPIYAFLLVRAWRQRDQAELELARLVVTDLLTGTLNRRGFFERAIGSIGQARRAGQIVSVAMLDIDHFKGINDQSGHAAGDEVLQRFAATVALELRPGDVFGRLGGDEFAVLLPGDTDDIALQTAERLRARVRAEVANPAGNAPTTVSAGVTSLLEGIEPEPALVTALCTADSALYAAKQAGRDRALLAPSATPPRRAATG